MANKLNEVKTKAALLIALERSLGIVTSACKDVGVGRTIFYEYCNSDPDFKKAVDDINEITLDFAENQLLKKIKEGSERSILFYMKYRGRKRGYTENIDVTSNGQTIAPTINVNIVPPKPNDE